MASSAHTRKATICFALLSFIALLSAGLVRAQERPESLEGVSIERDYAPSEFKQAGRIERILGDGRVVVLHRADGMAFYASVEDPVHENDAVYTLGEVRCRILLEDKNVVTMAPDSDLIIDEVVLDSVKGEKRSLLEVTRGRAVFYAIRLFRFRDMRLRVKTPTATVGVRGTKFGTEIVEALTQGEGSGRLRVASREPVRLAQGPGNLLSRVFVAQGIVNVVSSVADLSQSLGENEVLEAGPTGLGPVQFNPQAVRSFMESVEGPLGAGGGAPPSPTDSGPPTDAQKQQQDDMMRQLDQVEEAKELQTDKGLEPGHDSMGEPSGHVPPPSGGESHHHSP